MQIRNKILEIVCQQLDVTPLQVKPDTAFVEDLGADSLAIVELTLALEEAFEIDVSDEERDRLLTLEDAVSYVSAKLAKPPESDAGLPDRASGFF